MWPTRLRHISLSQDLRQQLVECAATPHVSSSLACFLRIGKQGGGPAPCLLCAPTLGQHACPFLSHLFLIQSPPSLFILYSSATLRRNANQMRHDAQSCNLPRRQFRETASFHLVCSPTMAVNRLNHSRAGYWLKSFDPSV